VSELFGRCIGLGWDLIPCLSLSSPFYFFLLTKWHCHLFKDNTWFVLAVYAGFQGGSKCREKQMKN
jgi:hypothetical protein